MSGVKYHITPDGPKICKANKLDCRYSNNQHFDSKEKAQEFFENTKIEQNLPRLQKKKQPDFFIKPLDDDIYKNAAYIKQLESYEKYPYKKDVADMMEEEKERIRRLSESKGISYDSLIKIITTSEESWAAFMLPSPKKQNFQELALKNYLDKNLKNSEVKILSKGGKNAFYLKDGKIITGLNTNPKTKDGKKIKSLDLYIKMNNNIEIYCIAKVTDGRGGSQDEQYDDVVHSINEAKEDSSVMVFACLDGSYYKNYDSNKKTKIDHLQDKIKEDNLESIVFVGDYKSMLNKLNELSSEEE